MTSVARPRGNLTGFTTYDDFALVGKLLGILQEAFPRLARAVMIMHRDHPSIAGYQSQLRAKTCVPTGSVTIVKIIGMQGNLRGRIELTNGVKTDLIGRK